MHDLRDIEGDVKHAVGCGVAVVASPHGEAIARETSLRQFRGEPTILVCILNIRRIGGSTANCLSPKSVSCTPPPSCVCHPPALWCSMAAMAAISLPLHARAAQRAVAARGARRRASRHRVRAPRAVQAEARGTFLLHCAWSHLGAPRPTSGDATAGESHRPDAAQCHLACSAMQVWRTSATLPPTTRCQRALPHRGEPLAYEGSGSRAPYVKFEMFATMLELLGGLPAETAHADLLAASAGSRIALGDGTSVPVYQDWLSTSK